MVTGVDEISRVDCFFKMNKKSKKTIKTSITNAMTHRSSCLQKLSKLGIKKRILKDNTSMKNSTRNIVLLSEMHHYCVHEVKLPNSIVPYQPGNLWAAAPPRTTSSCCRSLIKEMNTWRPKDVVWIEFALAFNDAPPSFFTVVVPPFVFWLFTCKGVITVSFPTHRFGMFI